MNKTVCDRPTRHRFPVDSKRDRSGGAVNARFSDGQSKVMSECQELRAQLVHGLLVAPTEHGEALHRDETFIRRRASGTGISQFKFGCDSGPAARVFPG
ncbi:hypothetical protein [Cryobacterium melibiosiphilum]|uniref:hypothetical protein n=1 Tax=Cryobacterium melibiosiphilum TaxID=995039 RepID=UPI0011C21CCF|nr:hypothetical protein [Cryobacterium melibiosiphilum]